MDGEEPEPVRRLRGQESNRGALDGDDGERLGTVLPDVDGALRGQIPTVEAATAHHTATGEVFVFHWDARLLRTGGEILSLLGGEREVVDWDLS